MELPNKLQWTHGAGMKIKPSLSLTTKIFVQPLSCLFLRHNLSGLIQYPSFFSPLPCLSYSPLPPVKQYFWGIYNNPCTILDTSFNKQGPWLGPPCAVSYTVIHGAKAPGPGVVRCPTKTIKPEKFYKQGQGGPL